MRTPPGHRVGVVVRGGALLASLAFLGMWASSYRLYTSFGVDMERVEGASVIQTHYRLRWPGNGAFFVGYDAFAWDGSRPREPFDLGGAFFKAPRRPPEASPWNRRGFWLIRGGGAVAPAQAEPGDKVGAFWLGVPSLVPALLAGLLPLGGWLRRKRREPRVL